VETDSGLDRHTLGQRARRGFSWSLTNSVIRRLWTFTLGIILARLLVPADFGVYALALAALTILVSMNDLGVGVAIIRWQGDPARAARTATSISIGASIAMYAVTFALAPVIADLLDSPAATPVLRLITFAVVIDGFSGIPNALLERAFLQKRRLAADLSGIVVNAAVVLSLAVADFGPYALAWAIVAGNFVTAVGILILAPKRPRPGWNTPDARALVSVGLPLAGASLLVFAMLNVDYFVIAGLLGATALGFYLLAFNLASWPPNLLTVAIRRVSIPAFSQLASDRKVLYSRFTQIFGVVMTVTLPVAALLSILAVRVVVVLYGSRWLPTAQALIVLAPLGVARIGLNLCYDLFVAIGKSRTVLWLQGLWVAALIPAMIIGTSAAGIRGAAIAHVGVAFLIVSPAFAIALRRAQMPLRPLAATLIRPLGGIVALAVVVLIVDQVIEQDFLALAVGGLVGIVVYGAAAVSWRGGRPDVKGTFAVFQGADGSASS